MSQSRTKWYDFLVLIGMILFMFAPTVYSVEASLPQQKNALDMIDKISGNEKAGKLKQDLKKVFEHYDQVGNQINKKSTSQVKNRHSSVEEVPRQYSIHQRPNLQTAKQSISVSSEEIPMSVLARDPFAVPTGLIRQVRPEQQAKVNESGKRSLTPEYSFTRLKTGVKVPKLTLKGLILKSKDQKAAVLEVGSFGTYIVREGDTIRIPDGEINNVIKVTKIDRLSLLVEVGKIGEVIIVR